jgi:hypothetical protein
LDRQIPQRDRMAGVGRGPAAGPRQAIDRSAARVTVEY